MEERKSELEIPAKVENLPEVKQFIERGLKGTGCSLGILKKIHVAVEEIFVNIASYAYAPGTGPVKVCLELTGTPLKAKITFADRGIPYNPLESTDPDVTLSVADRKIGGLGIFLTKMTMDAVDYRYEGRQNILTIRKEI